MPWVAAIGAIGSGIAGSIMQNNAAKGAQHLARDASNRFYDINDPDYEAMKLQLEDLKNQGMITPEQEQLLLQDPSAMQQIHDDPRLRQTELDSLSKLAGISSEGGMDAQARLGLAQAQMAGQQQARGARDANLQNAAQRGVAGSGLEFVSNQMADQNAANQSQMVGLQNAAAANQRDLSALGMLGSQANTMSQNDFSNQARIAQAKDAINNFNTMSAQGVQQRNIAAQNNAQAANLANQQQIANQNAMIHNSQQQYNKSLEQQKFQNEMDRARGAAGLAPLQASATQASGQAMGNLFGGIGQTVAGLGSAYAKQQSDQQSSNDYNNYLKARYGYDSSAKE